MIRVWIRKDIPILLVWLSVLLGQLRPVPVAPESRYVEWVFLVLRERHSPRLLALYSQIPAASDHYSREGEEREVDLPQDEPAKRN